ncbi:L,D-transpeptidase family protein [Anditalea andensis]|nr:L,D-transpeptidase family protein [Anditalea andensis]
MKFYGFALYYLLLVLFLCVGCGRNSEFSDRFKQRLKADTGIPGKFHGDLIYNLESIAALYEEEDQIVLPKWGNIDKVNEMLYVIRNISQDGLHPQDYHLMAIEALVEKVFYEKGLKIDDKVNLELLLTDAYLMISTHLSAGKTDQETVDPRWMAAKRTARHDLARFTDSTIVYDRVIESIESLTPSHREYSNLKKGLAIYRDLEANGGWEPIVITGIKLEKGISHPDVAKLKKRLSAGQSTDSLFFDDKLYASVLSFQKIHGLTADGIVGKETVEALNISVYDRIAAIEANLERWRWLSDELGEKYIKVNIANFEMQVVENDQPVFTCEAIVGRPYRQTPVFSSVMNHLVLAPTWTVPPTILWQDIIPAVKKNPEYFSQKNMQLIRNDGTVVNPVTVDWKNVNRSNFPYMVRQAPGKDNALGSVKFMFPNQHSIYIHDTPARNLFAQVDRSFSSGCIRISRPMELVEYLLSDKKDWTTDKIKRTIALGKEQTIFLTSPLPVHLLYMTTWAEDDGTVHFRKDIYNRDQSLLNALRQHPPKETEFIGSRGK